MVSESNRNGYDIVSQNYFSELRLHLKRDESSATRSSLCEARQKLSWKAFEYLLEEINLEKNTEGRWKGYNVRAIDGTSLTLPASKAILETFPRRKIAKAHYPNALMVTATNINTGQPIAARVAGNGSSERELLLSLLKDFKKGDLALLDRGFEGFRIFKEFEKLEQFFVCRVRQRQGFNTVCQFLKTGKRQAILALDDKNRTQSITVRAIRRKRDRKGDPIVIVTNLPPIISDKSIWKLYLKRWKIETMYYRVKELFHLEKFHARSINGLLQEIFANLFILSLTALIILRAQRAYNISSNNLKAPSFKNAAEIVRRNLIYFVERHRICSYKLSSRMIDEVIAVTFTRQPGRKNPRISKQPSQSWCNGAKNRPRNKWEKKRLALQSKKNA